MPGYKVGDRVKFVFQSGENRIEAKGVINLLDGELAVVKVVEITKATSLVTTLGEEVTLYVSELSPAD